MTDVKLFQDIAGILQIDEVDPDFVLAHTIWDSLTVMQLIAYIDQEFGSSVSAMKLAKCNTLGELCELIRASVNTI